MKFFLLIIAFCCVCKTNIIVAQSVVANKNIFFNDTSVINATIVSNMGKLFSRNKKGMILPAKFITNSINENAVDAEIQLETRGNMRHDYCYVPPLKLIFKNKQTSALASLKSLKLVNECKLGDVYDQYLLKEFIIYKMYNLINEMSFQARLLNVTFEDSAKKKKPISEHAFLIEDVKELAKRNNCKETKVRNLSAKFTDRKLMTVVAIFQFMIGNTDWAVAANHNIKLIEKTIDSAKKIFVIPYDFDYSGLVNTDYAIPSEYIGTEDVRERVYRGYPRTMEELNEALAVFKNKKDALYALINNFNLLTAGSKKYMTSYLDDFYKIINKPSDVKFYFIDNARKD